MPPPLSKQHRNVARATVNRTTNSSIERSEYTNPHVQVPNQTIKHHYINKQIEEAQPFTHFSVTPQVIHDESNLLPNKARLEGVDQRFASATNSKVQIHRGMADMI